MKEIKQAFTHGGRFHADDVFAGALLRILKPGIKIQRGNQVPENYDGVVFDIGFGKYDHHQPDSRLRENEIPYAAFGLLWEAYGQQILEEDALDFDRDFVQKLDEADNCGTLHEISKVISDFNSQWDLEEVQDEQFEKAVDFAVIILENRFRVYRSRKKAKNLIAEALQKAEDGIVILSQILPWKHLITAENLYYVVYPSARGGFNGQCIPKEPDSCISRMSFPKEWHGLMNEELVQKSKIPGLTFCHKSGFLIAGDDCASVIAACRKSMKSQR